MDPTKPSYDKSSALVIGINLYSRVSPLSYAVNDANAVADILESEFGFESVTRLVDANATRSNISREYLRFAGDLGPDDRLLVYFAGHGHTQRARRGEVGYLVPFDGDLDDLSTLIRWDTLTRDAELIAAKHILFVMDACYGGLAIMRAMPPGASRFLKDMLKRTSRQVITAGKADEQVSDSGGPRAGHSIFTGHFLDAISGAAASSGLISANGVMAYVYQRVGTDPDSTQTPHFGYLNGDGDFIFNPPKLSELDVSDVKEEDILVAVSGTGQNSVESFPDRAKTLLATPTDRIKLHDLISNLTRTLIARTDVEQFPVRGEYTQDTFAERLERYNKAIDETVRVQMLLGRWGTDVHSEIVAMPSKRLAERIDIQGGQNVWLWMRWYPVWTLIYSSGLGALASQNYSSLHSLLSSRLVDHQDGNSTTLIKVANDRMPDTEEFFRILPERERQYVPLSEYFFKQLQPLADDILFLGSDYEQYFDRLETILALEGSFANGWGRLGRFAWKHSNLRRYTSPLKELADEAETHGVRWKPLLAGFFGGSIQNFHLAVSDLEERISLMNWR